MNDGRRSGDGWWVRPQLCSGIYLNSTADRRCFQCIFNDMTLNAPTIRCQSQVKPAAFVLSPILEGLVRLLRGRVRRISGCSPDILSAGTSGVSVDASDATSSKTASCLSCGESLQTKAALARHQREVHSEADVSSEASVGSNSTGGQNNDASVARVACEKCGRTFKNKSNLKIHMLTHSGLKPFG